MRIFRACYDLGIHTVAMYSKEDELSLFRTRADEAYLVGENKSPLGAYLDIPEIIDLAKRRGGDAIHPGYGFLSENADFARACEEAGITFIGPPSDVLGKMGDKLSAKQIAMECGVPVIPGCSEPLRARHPQGGSRRRRPRYAPVRDARGRHPRVRARQERGAQGLRQ